MAIVRVASDNPVKVEAIKAALERYYVDVEAISHKVKSGVPEQPTNSDVFKGAENRLQEIKASHNDYDFVASCESGLLYLSGHWFNIQVVIVENKEGKRGYGVSQGYEVPAKYLDEILRTNIAELLHRLFKNRGGTRILTRNQFTRKALIEHAAIMALASVINGDIW